MMARAWRREHVPRRRRCGQGAALIVALLMLSVTLMLALSAAQVAMQDEKAARNARDRQVALQAAEAALTDAEQDIENSTRSHLFASERSDGFADGCGGEPAAVYLGMCRSGAGYAPAWLAVDFLEAGQARFVTYGRFTGRRLQTGDGMLPALAPRYIIELLARDDAEKAASGNALTYFYRITAVGFGVRESTRVMLQAFYRKSGGNRETIVPAGRFGWREIENWQELRNAYADN